MAGDWRDKSLGEVCGFVTGGAFPKEAQGGSVGKYPFIKVSDMNLAGNEKDITTANNWVSEETRASLKAKVHPAGATVFAKIGVALTYNRRRLLQQPTLIDNNMMSVVPGDGAVHPLFLYYLLCTIDFNPLAVGTALPYLRIGDLSRIPISLPPNNVQQAIACTLGALDDKIELNLRMNRTLEATARTIFQSWFVDFDPVRAKSEGRDPGLPTDNADLFPDSFEDSELGEIPRGWEASKLGTLGGLAIGGDWGKEEAFDGALEASCLRGVDLGNLRRDGHALPPRRWFKPASLDRRAMDDRDVLVAGSGVGPTGRPLWMCAALLNSLGPCVYSNFCKRIRCDSAVKAVYLDAWLHEMRNSGEIWEYVGGTSVPNLDAKSLLASKAVPMPSLGILEKYYDFVSPIWQRKYVGENETLASLRDALLPKLISGELQVEDAERVVRRCA